MPQPGPRQGPGQVEEHSEKNGEGGEKTYYYWSRAQLPAQLDSATAAWALMAGL
jgi:hypothetical protein